MKLFETLKFEDGVFHNLSLHQERLDKTLKDLNYPHSYSLEEILTKPQINSIHRTKFIYDQTSYSFEHFTYKAKEVTSLTLVDASHIDYKYKKLNRSSIDYLKSQSEDEIILIQNDYVTDTSIANLYFLRNNTWYTPSSTLLKGTYQKLLINQKKVKIADIKVEDIFTYEKIAVSNAMLGFFELNKDIIPNIKNRL